MRKALLRLLLLALAAVLALLSGIPAANPPVKVYESAAVLAPLCALLAVWFLFRALYDVLACYAYYVTG